MCFRCEPYLTDVFTLGRFHCPVRPFFQPGDWMFINLPVISKFEWHPFTISSAPERRDDVLTFHIRSVGGWTNKLHEYFVEENRLIEDERAGRVAKERKSMIPRYTLLNTGLSEKKLLSCESS